MKKFPYSPRPATTDDLDQVAEIEKLSIVPPWPRAAFAAELDKKSGRFWVLTDNETDEKVVAYAVFSFPADQAHLITFAVHPSYRRQGLGLYLLRRLIHYVMRKQGDSVVLEVRKGNAAAVQLYQSLGFMVIHTIPRFYPDGEDAYSMIFKTDRNRLTGDAEVDFDTDSDNNGAGGKPTIN
ncbi:MAG: ribosomal protein S18-alanine N-acetyltransferase [Bdellovibrionota bacterium]